MPRPVGDWRVKYGVVDPTRTEIIGWSLFNRVAYTSGTDVQTNFFTTAPSTPAVGNVPLGTQLAASTAFFVQAIRIIAHVKVAATATLAVATSPVASMANDLWLIYNAGVLKVDVLNKNYVNDPNYLFVPGTGLSDPSWSGGDSTAGKFINGAANWGMPDARAVYVLAVPFVIPPQTPFPTTILWFGGAANAAGAITLNGGNTDITVMLDGQLARPVQ